MWRMMLGVVLATGLVGACSDGSNGEDEFVEIMGKVRAGTFTVTYDVDGPEGATDAVTWYRMDETQRLDSAALTSIQGAEGAYVCSATPTIATQNLAGCVIEPRSVPLHGGPSLFLDIAIKRPEQLEAERLDDREIVGESVPCFDVKAGSGDGSDFEACFTSEGVPLYVEAPLSSIDNRIVYVATTFSIDTPEGIFEPPLEIVGMNPVCAELDC